MSTTISYNCGKPEYYSMNDNHITENPITIEEFLTEKGEFLTTTVGVSMYPLLKDKQYVVRIVPANGRLKKYDIALFHRGDQIVLHRVVKVYPDHYFIRGDNCEGGDIVYDNQIIGVLSEITGKKKHIRITDKSYIAYSRLTVFWHPYRYFFTKTYRRARRIARRVLKGKK